MYFVKRLIQKHLRKFYYFKKWIHSRLFLIGLLSHKSSFKCNIHVVKTFSKLCKTTLFIHSPSGCLYIYYYVFVVQSDLCSVNSHCALHSTVRSTPLARSRSSHPGSVLRGISGYREYKMDKLMAPTWRRPVRVSGAVDPGWPQHGLRHGCFWAGLGTVWVWA